MNSEYKVRYFFNDNGEMFDEIVTKFLIFFLDKEFNKEESNGIINTDVIPNL